MSRLSSAEILAALVAFDTTSARSNLDLIAWVEAYLDRHGVRSERVYDSTGAKANLWATVGPADRGGYVLSGHTDVVPVEGQAWNTDPFTLTARDGRLYGRGSCDMKGFLACCLAALPDMLAAPLATPLHLAFSYDEEVGCVGVRGMIARLGQDLPLPLGCFVGEPTAMEVATGHKGKRSVRVTARGKACHSSLAPQGVNAVEWLARLVVEVQALGLEFAAGGARDELYDVPHSTAHVGTFHGGTALNIVPHEASIVFEVRVVGADDADAAVARIVRHAREVLEPAMQAVDPESGFDIAIYAGFPGLDTAEDAPIVTLAKGLAGRNSHCKVAYGTEAGLFQQAGVPTVIVGPGRIEQAHKPDEYIAASELAACDAFIGRLVERCRG